MTAEERKQFSDYMQAEEKRLEYIIYKALYA